jgi:NAD(P)-dependent dehydrogenase (short-subunit alcohol dehydrogenase family)
MVDAGARAHFVASHCAIPLMLPQRRGLIITTTYVLDGQPDQLVLLAKGTSNGLIALMAHQLRAHSIAAVGVSPTGWVWSGWVLQAVYEALHTTGTVEPLFRAHPEFIQGESPEYTGRAVAALATDPDAMEKSGQVFRVDKLAKEYGFTDIDGRRPPDYGLREHAHG